MSAFIREKPLVALWIATAVVLVGRLVDLQWHLTHDDFEGAADQIRAHLILWIGVLMLLAVAALAIRDGMRGLGWRLVLGGALLYVPVATWHFIEHANGTDPELAHVLIAVSYLVMLVGVAWASWAGVQQRRIAS